MFCPKCGQEQAFESVRFCLRCGFKSNTVEEGLAKRFIVMAMYLVITICAMFGWGSITAGPGYMAGTGYHYDHCCNYLLLTLFW